MCFYSKFYAFIGSNCESYDSVTDLNGWTGRLNDLIRVPYGTRNHKILSISSATFYSYGFSNNAMIWSGILKLTFNVPESCHNVLCLIFGRGALNIKVTKNISQKDPNIYVCFNPIFKLKIHLTIHIVTKTVRFV